MKRIKRSSFINAFNRIKKSRKLSTAKVARNSSLSRSYVYHVVSPRYKMDVTTATAFKVGQGLGLNHHQIKAWIRSMTLVPQNGSAQHRHRPKRQPKQNVHHSSVHHRPTVHRKKDTVPARQSRPMNPQQRKLMQTVRNLMSTEEMSTEKLAERGGLNEQRVSDYINGKDYQIPKLMIVKLARALKVNPTRFLNLVNPHQQTQIKNNQPASNETNYQHQSIKKTSAVRVHPKRRSIRRIMEDINKLNDADIAIVDLIVNRIAEAERRDYK